MNKNQLIMIGQTLVGIILIFGVVFIGYNFMGQLSLIGLLLLLYWGASEWWAEFKVKGQTCSDTPTEGEQ